MKSLLSSFIIFLLIFTYSCKSGLKDTDIFEPFFSTYKTDSTGTLSPIEKNEIFYGILTPVEICTIFSIGERVPVESVL